MSKRMKIVRYALAAAILLLFTAYILKIAGIGFLAPLKDCVLLFPFWVLIAISMILIIKTQRKAKETAEK